MPFDLEEHGRGEPAEALVAVDERVVVDDRLQQGCRLCPDVGIGVLAADRRLRPRHCGPQEPDVAHPEARAEKALSKSDDVIEVDLVAMSTNGVREGVNV